jgi:hypothetical protein
MILQSQKLYKLQNMNLMFEHQTCFVILESLLSLKIEILVKSHHVILAQVLLVAHSLAWTPLADILSSSNIQHFNSAHHTKPYFIFSHPTHDTMPALPKNSW